MMGCLVGAIECSLLPCNLEFVFVNMKAVWSQCCVVFSMADIRIYAQRGVGKLTLLRCHLFGLSPRPHIHYKCIYLFSYPAQYNTINTYYTNTVCVRLFVHTFITIHINTYEIFTYNHNYAKRNRKVYIGYAS